MSMLAEPRRKQKIINLRAKNNAWSNDTNKFGQRMLEKMGWSSGKGLGANENGIVEHVVARYKNDETGIGYEDRNDQWTKHEDDFNALLANLSSDKDTSNEVLHSGVSLEVKSKKSKARIHYHKFTRGKDISRYSEKDLANIFGKKSFKIENMTECVTEDASTTEQAEQVFTEKGSMEDYFKSKMELLKSKFKTDVLERNDSSNDNCDFVFKGFSCDDNKDDSKKNSLYSMFVQSNDNDAPDSKLLKKIKRKKSKNKEMQENETDQTANTIQDTEENSENINEDELMESTNITHFNESESLKEKKKKKKKSKSKKCVVQDTNEEEKDLGQELHLKKEKKKKNKLNSELFREDEPQKKKKRKNKELDI